MSAKHEKDYEYPLQINGRRVGNTTRLVDWMVQRWFMDGGFQISGNSLLSIGDAIRKFEARMASEHQVDARCSVALTFGADDRPCKFPSQSIIDTKDSNVFVSAVFVNPLCQPRHD